jgi:peroxiredoxin
MRSCRLLVSVLIVAAVAWGARDNGTVEQAAARVEQLALQSTPALRPEFRVLAAQALQERYPELAAKFVRAALEDVASRDVIDAQLLGALAALAPEETIALLPHLKPGSDYVVADALVRANQARRAVAVYRAALGKGQPGVHLVPLFNALVKENPDEAKKLFAEMLAAFSYDAATPFDLYGLINSAVAVAPVAPALAADVYERVVILASAPAYGRDANPGFHATFQIGSATIPATNSRETLLIAAGARLRALAPDRFEKHKDVLAKWDLAGTFKGKGINIDRPKQDTPPAETAILERMRKLRDLPDAERAKAVLELAQAIQNLPKGAKANWASSLANLATEGDNGADALTAVAAALGQGIQESAPSARAYIELAQLIRYEHTRAPFSDPSLDAADAVLALRERVHQEAGFTLTGMDGKTYSLAALRGKVVLLNFWATWCPPCRKEMPDMETLYRRFESRGLVVIAVSDEERETVAGFLEKQHYTFPVLLDPDRKTNDAFGVEGIPKSFIFDAQGRLVAQAIDMRTERQFLELLKQAGLE